MVQGLPEGVNAAPASTFGLEKLQQILNENVHIVFTGMLIQCLTAKYLKR